MSDYVITFTKTYNVLVRDVLSVDTAYSLARDACKDTFEYQDYDGELLENWLSWNQVPTDRLGAFIDLEV